MVKEQYRETDNYQLGWPGCNVVNVLVWSYIWFHKMEGSDDKAMELADVKIRVLEAMAKLELKQQQEREESMNAPPKPEYSTR